MAAVQVMEVQVMVVMEVQVIMAATATVGFRTLVMVEPICCLGL
jgi:hypothetical protein